MLPKFLFLLSILACVNFVISNDYLTLDECNKSMHKKVTNDCKCIYEDYITCEVILTTYQICNSTFLREYYKTNLTDCDKTYAECNSKDQCLIGMCGCFKSMVACIDKKCALPEAAVKRTRSVQALTSFNELVGRNLDKTIELKKEE
uniref:Uncharacterized protein n=1 Tax=Meloidogyne incognita TaxID=6306 RepID=A0A914LT04_MELIC